MGGAIAPKEDQTEKLRTQVQMLSRTLRLFASPENWTRDNVWSPALQTIEARYPDTIAARALEACGL